MADQALLQKMFTNHGLRDFRWINPAEIVVAKWVRMKCTFGCDSYGRNAACPPNTPSVAECGEFFQEYKLGAVFRLVTSFSDPDELQAWVRKVNLELLNLEGDVGKAGYQKAFLLFIDSCNLCRECAKTRDICRNKRMARPSAEGMAVDLLATVQSFGFEPGSVGVEGDEHYAFLLLE
jgi:predicted metal-binding protein